jgi:hypothetical protein
LWLVSNCYNFYTLPTIGLIFCFPCDPQAMGSLLYPERAGPLTTMLFTVQLPGCLTFSMALLQIHSLFTIMSHGHCDVMSPDIVVLCPKSLWFMIVHCFQVLRLA